jgi:hypothetical protein
MFVGHYGVAFAVKTERNKIPLWVLFVAVQLLDFLWAPFVLLGVEKVRFVPGITATNALDLYYMPYTHSLIGALFWSAVAFAIYKIGWRNIASNRAALLVGFAVFSHWLLDLIVHRPDLAIYDDTIKVGFGLWNYRGIEFVLEIGILLIGAVLYVKRNGAIARKIGIIRCGAGLDSNKQHLPAPAALRRSRVRDHGAHLLHGFRGHCVSPGEATRNPIVILHRVDAGAHRRGTCLASNVTRTGTERA